MRGERGFGLVGVIITSTALLIIAVALTTEVLATMRYQNRGYLALRSQSIAEAGAEKAIWQLNQAGSSYSGETNTAFGGGTYTVTVTDVNASTKQLTVTASVQSGILPLIRKVKVTLSGTPSDQASFFYGVQVGAGGLSMSNGGVVQGSVYSAGNATASNTAQIQGDIWVTGSGTISGFTGGSAWGITGNAHAHTITGSEVQKDAYYQTLTSTTVGGVKYPGSADPAGVAFAISDAQIADWKTDASTGGTTNGNVSLSSGTTSLGPRKISGNLTLSNTAILNLTGPIWVTGAVSVSNSAQIKIDPSFGANGTYLITDSTVTQSNSASFKGSGTAKSYLLVVSTRNNTSIGSPTISISNGDSALEGDIFYAPYGWIQLSNSAHMRELTGYGLQISNSATVTYDQGLASASFSAGPGGRWSVTAWQQLKN